MSAYTGRVPDTIRAADWRENAPCKADPEAMYPGSHAVDIEYAKDFCRACPAIERCLQWALETGEEYGVWGGLSEKERRKLRRRKHARPPVDEVEEPPRPRTLAEAWKARTRPLDGGHLRWSGNKTLYFRGAAYTPKRAAFLIGRGTSPYGQVLATCGVDECIRPDHIADGQERALMHGSRPGYQRHLAAGETPCEPCRQANTDADNRLRRTGTSKAPATTGAPATIVEAFTQRAVRTTDGHLLWYGDKQIKFQNTKHSALRVAFEIGHGREADGPIRRTCGKDCFLGAHLTDTVIRDAQTECGTTAGYERHVRRGEDTCTECRAANAEYKARSKQAVPV